MKSYILCDSRTDFLNDINTSMLLDAYPFQVFQAKNLREAESLASQHSNADIILSEMVLKDADISGLPRHPWGFATSPQGNEFLASLNIKSIGFCRTSESLLQALSNDPLEVVNDPSRAPAPSQVNDAAEDELPDIDLGESQNQPMPAKSAASSVDEVSASQPAMPQMNPQQFSPEMIQMMMQMMMQMQNGNAPTNSSAAPAAGNTASRNEETATAHPSTAENTHKATSSQSTKSAGNDMRGRQRTKVMRNADDDIDEDLYAHNSTKAAQTKVIAVYAAKGGVGKTSIATELAVCLALTSNGRRRFRVCIVDYNIDFGDVATTLEFSDDGPNLSYWASEIRARMDAGEKPEDIQFSREEMDTHYLQTMKETGLLALCAPITHEDSMLVTPAELDVMLRNIVENGEFDFVICDTGNNTRDSSIIALDYSEHVLLVATQDVTTANCNASVLRTLHDSGFDTDKVRLVINNVMSSRETGISVQEVEETFPYQCVCRIKRTSDIIRANNLSKPLVYKPNHDYTKQIQKIVRYITGGGFAEEPPKKGLFGRRR